MEKFEGFSDTLDKNIDGLEHNQLRIKKSACELLDTLQEVEIAEILVVDDCQLNVVALSSLLQQFNCTSEFSNDGREAIEQVKARLDSKHQLYKLIMMDYSMPICDGPTTTIAIREILTARGISRDQQPFICCLSAYSE